MVMKKFSVMTAICAIGLMLFGACTKEDPKQPDGPGKEGNAKLLSYGFFKEDNAQLDKDYIAEVSEEMIIRLPEAVEKSSLVARFTAEEGNKVFVAGTEQISGKTVNDFTYPVDYIVKDETAGLNKKYTVKVGKILTMKWSEVAIYNEAGCTNDDFAMCISPKDQTPHLFILRERLESDAEGAPKLTVGLTATFKDGVLTAGKEITYVKDNKTFDDAQYPDITCDKEGNVYVSYYNYVSSSDYNIFVRKADGGLVGEPFCKTKVSNYTQLEVDPVTKHLVSASYANSAFDQILRRGVNLAYNKSGAWEGENTVADFSDREVHRTNFYNNGKALYMGGQLAGKGKEHAYFVYKYNNGSWDKIINVLPEGMSGAAQLIPSPIAVASDGTAYMLAGNDAKENGKWFIQLMKCTPGSVKWENVGAPIVDNLGNNQTARYSSYVLELCNDNPVVVYLNQDDANKRYPVALTYNKETQAWDPSLKLADIHVNYSNLKMVADANGTLYLAFIDGTESNALHLYKYGMEKDDLVE